jgi:hypothetical protein
MRATPCGVACKVQALEGPSHAPAMLFPAPVSDQCPIPTPVRRRPMHACTKTHGKHPTMRQGTHPRRSPPSLSAGAPSRAITRLDREAVSPQLLSCRWTTAPSGHLRTATALSPGQLLHQAARALKLRRTLARPTADQPRPPVTSRASAASTPAGCRLPLHTARPHPATWP